MRRRKDGTLVDISLTVSPIIDASGTIIGASKIARDISERRRAQEALAEQTEILETVNNLAQTLAGELEGHKVVQAITDAATEITEARFGSFFYNVLDEQGKSNMLYADCRCGARRISAFPHAGNTEIFSPTFKSEGTVLIDDVKKDPRYGKNSPYFGMADGHLPVTSYLSVPVVSRSGEVYGVSFLVTRPRVSSRKG